MERSFIQLDRSLIDQLTSVSDVELRVFLVLADRSVSGIRIGMTLNELARTADVSQSAARRALQVLNERDPVLIRMTKRSSTYDIQIDAQWMTDTQVIRFSYADTDAKRIATAEAEMRRLDVEYRQMLAGESSGIANQLTGEDRDVIIAIEKRFGALSPLNAFHIGKVIGRFGPARVKTSWRSVGDAKNPVRALVGKLINGAYGNDQKPPPDGPKEPKYYEHT